MTHPYRDPPPQPSRDLTGDVDDLKRQAKLARWVLGVLAVPILGGVGMVARTIYDRGGRDAAIELRLQQLERTVDRLERRNDRLRDPQGREP